MKLFEITEALDRASRQESVNSFKITNLDLQNPDILRTSIWSLITQSDEFKDHTIVIMKSPADEVAGAKNALAETRNLRKTDGISIIGAVYLYDMEFIRMTEPKDDYLKIRGYFVTKKEPSKFVKFIKNFINLFKTPR